MSKNRLIKDKENEFLSSFHLCIFFRNNPKIILILVYKIKIYKKIRKKYKILKQIFILKTKIKWYSTFNIFIQEKNTRMKIKNTSMNKKLFSLINYLNINETFNYNNISFHLFFKH